MRKTFVLRCERVSRASRFARWGGFVINEQQDYGGSDPPLTKTKNFFGGFDPWIKPAMADLIHGLNTPTKKNVFVGGFNLRIKSAMDQTLQQIVCGWSASQKMTDGDGLGIG